MWSNPLKENAMKCDFQPNELVTCVDASGYPQLTEGKQYLVLDVQEEIHEQCFTWPEYIVVATGHPLPTICHTYRFKR